MIFLGHKFYRCHFAVTLYVAASARIDKFIINRSPLPVPIKGFRIYLQAIGINRSSRPNSGLTESKPPEERTMKDSIDGWPSPACCWPVVHRPPTFTIRMVPNWTSAARVNGMYYGTDDNATEGDASYLRLQYRR